MAAVNGGETYRDIATQLAGGKGDLAARELGKSPTDAKIQDLANQILKHTDLENITKMQNHVVQMDSVSEDVLTLVNTILKIFDDSSSSEISDIETPSIRDEKLRQSLNEQTKIQEKYSTLMSETQSKIKQIKQANTKDTNIPALKKQKEQILKKIDKEIKKIKNSKSDIESVSSEKNLEILEKELTDIDKVLSSVLSSSEAKQFETLEKTFNNLPEFNKIMPDTQKATFSFLKETAYNIDTLICTTERSSLKLPKITKEEFAKLDSKYHKNPENNKLRQKFALAMLAKAETPKRSSPDGVSKSEELLITEMCKILTENPNIGEVESLEGGTGGAYVISVKRYNQEPKALFVVKPFDEQPGGVNFPEKDAEAIKYTVQQRNAYYGGLKGEMIRDYVQRTSPLTSSVATIDTLHSPSFKYNDSPPTLKKCLILEFHESSGDLDKFTKSKVKNPFLEKLKTSLSKLNDKQTTEFHKLINIDPKELNQQIMEITSEEIDKPDSSQIDNLLKLEKNITKLNPKDKKQINELINTDIERLPGALKEEREPPFATDLEKLKNELNKLTPVAKEQLEQFIILDLFKRGTDTNVGNCLLTKDNNENITSLYMIDGGNSSSDGQTEKTIRDSSGKEETVYGCESNVPFWSQSTSGTTKNWSEESIALLKKLDSNIDKMLAQDQKKFAQHGIRYSSKTQFLDKLMFKLLLHTMTTEDVGGTPAELHNHFIVGNKLEKALNTLESTWEASRKASPKHFPKKTKHVDMFTKILPAVINANGWTLGT